MALGCLALPAEVTEKIGSGSVIEASAENNGVFSYSILDDGTVEITDYFGLNKNLTIPNTIDGKKVTRIGRQAFYKTTYLTSVTIPDSVKIIGNCAFSGCSSLSGITIPNSVVKIDNMAFGYCSSLTSVTIPNSVTSIGNNTFSYCSNLTSVAIPSSVKSIGNSAFWYCTSLKSVTIPSSVTSIGDAAFYRCTSLKSIIVNSNNKSYSSANGALFNKDKTKLIQYPTASTQTSYTIPSSVTSICSYAFSDCTNLKSVTIPSGMKNIDAHAFSGCTSLTSISIPKSVTGIGEYAFSECTNLKSISIPNSVTSVGGYAFNGCSSLTNVIVPSSVTSIGNGTFSDCTKLASVTIAGSIKNIDVSVFNSCSSLTSIIIPKSVTSISYAAFYGCSSLKNIYYTGSKTQWNKIVIGDYNSVLTKAAVHCDFDPNHTHSYTSKTTKAATCTSTGVKTFTCSCGDTYTQTISKTAHTYKTTVVSPTYAAQGYTLHKCSVCGTSYKDKYTAKKTVPTVAAKSTYTCTTNAVRINWNKVSGATGYKIYRYNPTTKQWTALKAIYDPNVLTYKDSSLKSGTVYKYKVKAFVKSGGKFYFGSSCSTITTATKPATATITKTAKSSTAVRLYWKKVTCTGYKIQRYNSTTKKWVDVKTISSATTNYRIASLKKNTSYKFRVCAYKNDGKKNLLGAWSYVTVTTTK